MFKRIKKFLWRFQFSDPDPDAFLRELKTAQLGSYNRMQRYRDFRLVFMGTPEGKRVLNQIMAWGRVYGNLIEKGSSDDTYIHLGERELVIKVLRVINLEPSEKQQTQTVKVKEETD